MRTAHSRAHEFSAACLRFSLDTPAPSPYNAPTRYGGIAKWPKATVCKTVIRGFKSHSRLSHGTVCPPQRGRTVPCFSRVRVNGAQWGAMRFAHFRVHRIVHFWVHPLVHFRVHSPAHFPNPRTRFPCGLRECCPNGTPPRCAPSAGAGFPFRAECALFARF